MDNKELEPKLNQKAESSRVEVKEEGKTAAPEHDESLVHKLAVKAGLAKDDHKSEKSVQ